MRVSKGALAPAFKGFAVVAVFATVFALPAVASATTDVSIGTNPAGQKVISLNQSAGEASNINVSVITGNTVRVAAGNGRAVPGGGCSSAGGGAVNCPYSLNNTVVGASLNDKADYYSGTLPVWVDGGAGADNITGSGGGDLMVGGPGNDTLRGQIGNDTLIGGDNDDKIWGDGGHDTLLGEGGVDVLHAYNVDHGETVDCGAGSPDKAFADGFLTPNFPIGDIVTNCEKVVRNKNS